MLYLGNILHNFTVSRVCFVLNIIKFINTHLEILHLGHARECRKFKLNVEFHSSIAALYKIKLVMVSQADGGNGFMGKEPRQERSCIPADKTLLVIAFKGEKRRRGEFSC
jgi:hypothetical protein